MVNYRQPSGSKMHIWRRTDKFVSSPPVANLRFQAARTPWIWKMLFFICFSPLRAGMAEVSRRQMSTWTELCDVASHLICVVVIQRLQPKFSQEGRALCKSSFLFFSPLFTATLHLQSGTASLNPDSLPFVSSGPPTSSPVRGKSPQITSVCPEGRWAFTQTQCRTISPADACHSQSSRSTRSVEGSSQNQFCQCRCNKLLFTARTCRLSWLSCLPRRPRDHVGPHLHSGLHCRLK